MSMKFNILGMSAFPPFQVGSFRTFSWNESSMTVILPNDTCSFMKELKELHVYLHL